MIRQPGWKGDRWWTLGVVVLIIGATGCGASDDSKRSASENNSPESRSAGPALQEKEPRLTSVQETALVAGARYRIDAEGLSKMGLIQALTATGYSTADATFAANKVGADWKEEAVEAARDRLDELEYSKRSLIEHLGADGFTRAQAEYAVSKVYD